MSRRRPFDDRAKTILETEKADGAIVFVFRKKAGGYQIEAGSHGRPVALKRAMECMSGVLMKALEMPTTEALTKIASFWENHPQNPKAAGHPKKDTTSPPTSQI